MLAALLWISIACLLLGVLLCLLSMCVCPAQCGLDEFCLVFPVLLMAGDGYVLWSSYRQNTMGSDSTATKLVSLFQAAGIH